jgi:hypothetical protein
LTRQGQGNTGENINVRKAVKGLKEEIFKNPFKINVMKENSKFHSDKKGRPA